MATKKQILESDELLQQKRKAYHLSDEGFEGYKKFLSDPDQKKFSNFEFNIKPLGEIYSHILIQPCPSSVFRASSHFYN